ncbi:MAG TPA: hypothetical protein VFF87_05900 [Hyphomicrobium sp.]|nr:hypothetical protein [Hyphomicrobium sp.]
MASYSGAEKIAAVEGKKADKTHDFLARPSLILKWSREINVDKNKTPAPNRAIVNTDYYALLQNIDRDRVGGRASYAVQSISFERIG